MVDLVVSEGQTPLEEFENMISAALSRLRFAAAFGTISAGGTHETCKD